MRTPSGLVVAAVLARRELIRFARQPARIAAAIGTPALLWLFVGSGFSAAFRPGGLGETTYASFILPGMMTLVAVFSSIFSSISVIEDRRDGWLQAVLVSPAPRWSIALGKILGGAGLAWAQSAVLLPLLPLAGLVPGVLDVVLILAALALTSVAMTALGLAFAWRCQTSAAFHAVMNLVFMPMWLLSGAFFPPDGAARWLGVLMRLNPLTWCTEGIRGPMLDTAAALPLLGTALFAIATFAAATAIIARPTTSNG